MKLRKKLIILALSFTRFGLPPFIARNLPHSIGLKQVIAVFKLDSVD